MTSGMEHEIELRLKWRHTWPDREQDFVAEAPGYSGSVCRIYESLKAGSTATHWFWAMNAHGYEISRAGRTSGYEATARQAARAAEDGWFAAIRGTSLEHVVPEAAPANSYAAAKGRA